jgi:hypothetical protein
VRSYLFIGILLMSACYIAKAEGQTVEIHIKVINGKNGKPIKDEKLNLWRSADQRDAEIMPTDKDGVITFDVDRSGSIRVGSNIYVTCHPYKSGETERFHAVQKILTEGIADLNECSKVTAAASPGELIVFERPRSLLEWYRL